MNDFYDDFYANGTPERKQPIPQGNRTQQLPLTSTRQQIIDDVKRMLGGSMVDVELDAEDYSTALRLAFDRYRQRSGNAIEESYMFLRLIYEQNEYYLPEEVITVRQIFRRGIGETTGGTQLDPFALAYTNLYLLQAGTGGGYSAGLLTYELFWDFEKQAGRMFGRDLLFTYDSATKKLVLMRKPVGGETLLLWTYNYRPDDIILNDPFARPWIRDYTLAFAKQFLGEAYSKYSSIVGPGGGTTLKGDALKTESETMKERLEKEIDNYVDGGGVPLGIIIG